LASAPLDPAERIDAIDVLRGLALLGVLAVNLLTEFRVSIFEQFLPVANSISPLDRAIQTFLKLAVELKAYALFSFLFGVGLAIQHERLAQDARRAMLLVRRLAILLVFGLVHLFLIWNGDILTQYALAAMIVLPFLWTPCWLTGAAALVCLTVYVAMPVLPPVAPWPTTAWMVNHVAEATHVYATGSFSDVLAFRSREVPAICPLHVLIFPRTVALFLFGMIVWRTDVLRRPSAHQPLLFALAIGGVLIGGGLTLATEGRALFERPFLGGAQLPLEGLATVVLAAGYGAAVIAMASTAGGKRMLAWAAPLGRMAFTNYLVQSLVFGWIFYGYGLGLFGHLSLVAALAIGICVAVAQVMISAQWLRYYRFGPVEWLWRTLMYGRPQPMRQS
jgi:uncharacterized protein